MQYFPIYTTANAPEYPPSFGDIDSFCRAGPPLQTLISHLDRIAHESRLSLQAASAYSILALCAGLIATACGPAFADSYDYLVEGFDIDASDPRGPVSIGSFFPDPFVPLLKQVARKEKLPALRAAIPVISAVIRQSAASFMTVDPDLHPGYLAEGLWRLFAYIRASQANEAAYLISLIATDVQSTIGAADVLRKRKPTKAQSLGRPTMLPITEPLSTTYEEDTLERLRSRRMQLVLGNHELELAWVDHRIAEVERAIKLWSNHSVGQFGVSSQTCH